MADNKGQNSFFVRLCYGYVGKYKDTSKMTTKEVIDEFLKKRGVSSPKEFFEKAFSRQKQSGAISGALDSDSEKALEHAIRAYEAIRKNKYDIEKIAKNTGFSIEQIKQVKDYIFYEKHGLEKGEDLFDPDYDMALSWQRMEIGKDIWESDIIMIKHELLERQYEMQGISHNDAHDMANEQYNYKFSIDEERRKKNGKG